MVLELDNWLLVFLRVGAFLLALPFFSMTNFPVTMRVALSALVAALLAPVLPPFPLDRLPLLEVIGVAFREISIGLLLGFSARMVFFAVELAGNLIAMQMGLNMSAIMDPASSQSEQAPATMLVMLATVVMLSMDLHQWMLAGFVRAYDVLPAGGGHLDKSLFDVVVMQTSGVFAVAVQIAAPMIAVSFVVTLIFAVLSRAVPQMNVFSESFGVRIIAGFVVFGFTLRLAAQYVVNYLHRLPDDLLTVAQLLGAQ